MHFNLSLGVRFNLSLPESLTLPRPLEFTVTVLENEGSNRGPVQN